MGRVGSGRVTFSTALGRMLKQWSAGLPAGGVLSGSTGSHCLLLLLLLLLVVCPSAQSVHTHPSSDCHNIYVPGRAGVFLVNENEKCHVERNKTGSLQLGAFVRCSRLLTSRTSSRPTFLVLVLFALTAQIFTKDKTINTSR